jgi:hypothetical protein
MPKILQHRRDSTSALTTILGAEGEFFMDTEKKTIVVMDGTTTGGTVLAKEEELLAVSSIAVSRATTGKAIAMAIVFG